MSKHFRRFFVHIFLCSGIQRLLIYKVVLLYFTYVYLFVSSSLPSVLNQLINTSKYGQKQKARFLKNLADILAFSLLHFRIKSKNVGKSRYVFKNILMTSRSINQNKTVHYCFHWKPNILFYFVTYGALLLPSPFNNLGTTARIA